MSHYRQDSLRVKAIHDWQVETASSVRLLSLLAWIRPAVLTVLRSNVMGLDATRIPVPSTFPGWRYRHGQPVAPRRFQHIGLNLMPYSILVCTLPLSPT